MRHITDYGVLMHLFIDVLIKKDAELAHKSFIKKITNVEIIRIRNSTWDDYRYCYELAKRNIRI